ncbi:putative RNA-directed DNA polymerase, eukaryota, reverse transcriptase zinc-binding domain protein [Tanacetum coccineum]
MAAFEKHKLLLFKADFEKAFDSVNWNFLMDVMRQMGFRAKWGNWISLCLLSATISVMINGSHLKEFKMEHGLWLAIQGAMLAESGVNVFLLQYADDALFFGKWSRLNAKNIMDILKCFEIGSGLKVNLAKSMLMRVRVSICDVEAMAFSIGFFAFYLPSSPGWQENASCLSFVPLAVISCLLSRSSCCDSCFLLASCFEKALLAIFLATFSCYLAAAFSCYLSWYDFLLVSFYDFLLVYCFKTVLAAALF